MEKTSSQTLNECELPRFTAIIAASGSGSRFGSNIPKQYETIGEQSILNICIEKFLSMPNLDKIHVVIHPDHEDYYHDSVAPHEKLEAPIEGNKEYRSLSINNALEVISNLNNEDIVVIHDAARPFFDTEILNQALKITSANGAASFAVPVNDTLKRGNGEYVDRNDLWSIQTPQVFKYGLLKACHDEKAETLSKYTDDTSILYDCGHDVEFVQSSHDNFKITHQNDLEMAALIHSKSNTQQRFETRTGLGYDVHAFDFGTSGPVRLGGIDIDHLHKLKGHSDADVVLHTLTDALLGTLSLGDIGTHFPPSDNQWKDMDSAVFLEKAIELITQHGANFINCDITIICEKPQIGPHVQSMKERIAQICGCDVNRISVKATTSEKLGFTGRGEGIACQAVANIQVPCS